MYSTTSHDGEEKKSSYFRANSLLLDTPSGLIKKYFNTLRLFISLLLLGLVTIVNGQSSGIFETYAILNINGTGNQYYDLQANTGNPDFNGANLGTFLPSSSFLIAGGQNKVWVCGSDDVINGKIHYRVYKVGQPAPAFSSFIEFLDPVFNEFGAACGGAGKNQTWTGTFAGYDLLNGLTEPGNYYLEVFTTADYKINGVQQAEPHYSSNGGVNFKAEFTLCSISASIAVTNVLCFGSATGEANLTVTDGTAPFTYVWSNGATSEDITGLLAGTYSATVTDDNGCSANASVTLTQPAAALSVSAVITSNYNGRAVSCHNSTDGIIQVTASGGIVPYEYSRDGGLTYQTDNVFSGLGNPAGTPVSYSFRVKDANGCIVNTTTSITITPPPAINIPALSLTSNSPVCIGNTLNLSANPIGGTGTLTMNWIGPNGFVASNIQSPSRANMTLADAGNYRVFVTDINNCIANRATTVVVNPAPAVPINANNITECELWPIQTLTATATAPTGSTIVWYTEATGGSVVASPIGNTVGSITYHAASRDNVTGCESLTRAAVTLTINAAPAVPTNANNITECELSPIQTLTATATPAPSSTIVWYTAATGGSVVASPIGNTVGSITYYAASRDNVTGCESLTRASVTLTINAAPVVPTNANNITECELSPIQTLTATATPAPSSTIVWYTEATGGSVVASPIRNTVGSITYYAASRNNVTGCESLTRAPVTLTINAAPSVPTNANNITECELSPIQTLTATATAPTGSTVVWYTTATGGSVVSSPIRNTVGIITYYAASRDNMTGCESLTRSAVTLTIKPLPQATLSLAASYCNNAATNPTVGVNVILGGTFSNASFSYVPVPATPAWPANGLAINTTSGLINLAGSLAGDYLITYTFTGANGCVNTAQTIAVINAPPLVTVHPTPTLNACLNSDATFTADATGRPYPTVQWQKRTTGNSWTDISGATNRVYVEEDVKNPNQTTEYRAVFQNSCGTAISNISSMTVSSALNIQTVPVSQTGCGSLGSEVTFTTRAMGGQDLLSIWWEVSNDGGITWSLVPNSTTSTNTGNLTSTLTVPVAGNQHNQFRARYQNGACEDGSSSAVFMTVLPDPTITTIADQSVCNGATLGPIAIYGNYATSYQWSYPGPSIGLALTGTSLATGNPVATGSIPSFTAVNATTANIERTVTITAVSTGGNPQITCVGSTPTTFKIIVKPTPSAPTAEAPAACGPDNVTFTPTGCPGGTFRYYDGANGGTPLGSGATFTTFVDVTRNFYISCVQNGCEGPRATIEAIVYPVVAGTVGTAQTVCVGGNPSPLTSSIPASFTSPSIKGTLTYRWQASTSNDGGVTWSGWTYVTAGVTDPQEPPSFDPLEGITTTTRYRREVFAQRTNGPEPKFKCYAYSNVIIIDVIGLSNKGMISGGNDCAVLTPPTLTGTPATAVGGATPIYQWQSNTVGCTGTGIPWTNITGATGPSYTPSAMPLQTTYYRRLNSVILNGFNCPTTALVSDECLVINVFVGGNEAIWTGKQSIDWFDCRNWSTGRVPDQFTNVTIPASATCNVTIDPTTSYGKAAGGLAFANNFTITGRGLHMMNNGPIHVYGNWTNSAGAACFDAGNGIVAFRGINAQTISCTSGEQNFHNLVVNKPSAGNYTAGLMLNSRVNVGGILSLTSGVVVSNETNLLNITNCDVSAVDGGSQISYIHGRIRRCTQSTVAYLFPVGDPARLAGAYRPAYVKPETTAPNTFTAEYYSPNEALLDYNGLGTVGSSLIGVINDEQWYVKGENCSSDASIALPYINPPSNASWAGIGPNAPPVKCTDCMVAIAARYGPSLDWYFTDFPDLDGGTFDASRPESLYWEYNGLVWSKYMNLCTRDSYYSFGLGKVIVLPIQLITFSGVLENKQALLQWTVADNKEVNNFIIEHSGDGINFRKAGEVKAGNSANYRFVHNGLVSGNNYYRLYMIGKDGTKIYSKVVLIVYNRIITSIVSLKPTLVNDLTQVTVLSACNQAIHIQFFDTRGRLVRTEKAQLKMGMNTIPVYARGLASEMYIIHILTDDGVKGNYKIMKE